MLCLKYKIVKIYNQDLIVSDQKNQINHLIYLGHLKAGHIEVELSRIWMSCHGLHENLKEKSILVLEIGRKSDQSVKDMSNSDKFL